MDRNWENKVSSDLLLELRLKLTCTSPYCEGVLKVRFHSIPLRSFPNPTQVCEGLKFWVKSDLSPSSLPWIYKKTPRTSIPGRWCMKVSYFGPSIFILSTCSCSSLLSSRIFQHQKSYLEQEEFRVQQRGTSHIPKTHGYCTWGRVLMLNMVVTVGFDDLKSPFQP